MQCCSFLTMFWANAFRWRLRGSRLPSKYIMAFLQTHTKHLNSCYELSYILSWPLVSATTRRATLIVLHYSKFFCVLALSCLVSLFTRWSDKKTHSRKLQQVENISSKTMLKSALYCLYQYYNLLSPLPLNHAYQINPLRLDIIIIIISLFRMAPIQRLIRSSLLSVLQVPLNANEPTFQDNLSKLITDNRCAVARMTGDWRWWWWEPGAVCMTRS